MYSIMKTNLVFLLLIAVFLFSSTVAQGMLGISSIFHCLHLTNEFVRTNALWHIRRYMNLCMHVYEIYVDVIQVYNASS